MRNLSRLAALLVAGAVVSAPAFAQKAFVTVNGQGIPQNVYNVFIGQQKAQGAQDTPELKNAVKEELVRRELLAQEAKKKGLDKQADIQGQIELAKQAVLISAFIGDYMKTHPISEAQLKAEYEGIKAGLGSVSAPVYSHLVYDIVPSERITIDRPDILIVEGLNILQPGELPKSGKPIVFASDYIDFSIYLDADEADLRDWYMERFGRLRQTAFADPRSFFHRFSQMSEKDATDFGLWAWTTINLRNLRDNILPTRSRADLILRKGGSHQIEQVELRKL